MLDNQDFKWQPKMFDRGNIIADFIGATRVSVTRIINRLEREKLIDRPDRSYIILRPDLMTVSGIPKSDFSNLMSEKK